MAETAAQAAKQAMYHKMKHMLSTHDKGLKKPMAEQSQNYEAEIDWLKQPQMATHNRFAQKGTPTSTWLQRS
jgi:hypothetical protein